MANPEQLSEETTPSDDARNAVDRLADSFVARLRQGEHPSISEYAERYPELADEIRTVFSTLVMLERGGEEFLKAAQPSAASTSVLDELGEYRILREIGRGGMGIVYEAEHNTMRRRVALKVLPAAVAADDLRIKRFYLETRLAGRLHHTNIVPVFEVGMDRGYHYYAMQFIQGQNLDFVFTELRRLRHMEQITAHAAETEAATTLTHALGQSVAWSLHSGQFQKSSPAATPPVTDVRDEIPTDELSEPDRLSRSAMYANLSHSADPGDQYFRRVARVGLQIAEALQYAHAQGILHRDIKPSNIILDTAGVAWVTDFGLAKKEDDDLTQSGDVVGTMHYMAPERFEGKTDARSDLYGLGLTLYELCTLRNAFQATDRAQLIRDVCDAEPIAPRNVDPQIPRDLETIILKAIEKQPGRRYSAASQMTEDLRLFLSDHPIRSRRVSPAERVWRWCRRNPQQAVLTSCVLVLLLVVTVGSLAFGYMTTKHSVQLSESQQRATERLYESLRRSADASRWSHRPGQNVASVQEIAHAAEIVPQLGWEPARIARETVELRNAAIAAIALPEASRLLAVSASGDELAVRRAS